MFAESSNRAAYLVIAQFKTESTSSDTHELEVLHSQLFRCLGGFFKQTCLGVLVTVSFGN